MAYNKQGFPWLGGRSNHSEEAMLFKKYLWHVESGATEWDERRAGTWITSRGQQARTLSDDGPIRPCLVNCAVKYQRSMTGNVEYVPTTEAV